MSNRPRLKETRNYGRFDLHPINRNVKLNQKSVQKLRRSMLKHGFLPHKAIHVVSNGSGKLLIKDGHTRFHVARELGLPVWYIEGDDDDISIPEINDTTTPWSIGNWLESYAKQAVPSYVEVEEFYEDNQLPLGLCIGMLGGEMAGSGNKYYSFRHGNYKVTDEGRKHAHTVASLAETAKNAGIEFAKQQHFVKALSRVAFVKEIDLSELDRRLRTYPFLVQKQRTVDDTVKGLEDLYNYKVRGTRVPVAHLANEAARKRRIFPNDESQ